MKIKKTILLLGWTAFAVCMAPPLILNGQETVPPVVKAQVLGVLPDRVTFTKTFAYGEKPPASGDEAQKAVDKFMEQFDAKLARVVVEKTGVIRREFLNYVSGVNVERWVNGDIKFWIHSGQPSQIEVSLPGMYEEDPSANSDFGELSWVTPAYLKETAKLGSEMCKVYRRDNKTAWIMQTNLLPARFESPQMSVTYTYAPGPAQDLKLPGKFTERHKQVVDAWRGRTR